MISTTSLRTTAPHMGTVDPSGLAVEFSSQPALGYMVHTISAARWIITLTHTMAIVIHFRNAATSFLITLRKRVRDGRGHVSGGGHH